MANGDDYADDPARLRERIGELEQALEDARERGGSGGGADLEQGFADVIIDTTSALIIVLDGQGRIVRFNAGCEAATGYSEGEVRGRPIFDLLIPEQEREAVRSVFRQTAVGRSNFENHWVTRAGDLRLIAWANAPVLDDAGDVRWVVGTGIDVTDHRRLEEQLRRAARLEAVGQLAGGVAHDFNNLLTAILGYLDLNIPDLDRSSRLSADLRQVKHAAKRASDLTRQLLTFSRLQPYEPQLIDLNAAVAEVSGMLRHLIEEDIRTELDLDEELISVRADPAQIGQVVMNLAVNARDAMPEGGTMTVGTSMADIGAAQALMHPGVAPGGYACLWVADTGVGMDDATRERMFDPFFTTKEVGKGTGLGMSTVYGIVEQHGGFIECESEKGKGTKVSIFLPLASDASLTAGESSVLEFGMLGTETLLLAEDDAAVRKLASRVLQGMGYTVLEAAGGEEALALMDEHEGELDLLITDVVMPDISGIELAERMAAARPGLKVLFTSGYVGKLPKGRLADLEPSQILQKPFRAADLTERVRELLDAD